MIILLLGTIGAGKTSVGLELAKKLNFTFFEMDENIKYYTGSNEDISESAWKECQLELSLDLSTRDNMVIACSGDIVENNLNLIYFKENTQDLHIIYLEADEQTLVERVSKNNPNLDKKMLINKVNSLIENRQNLYRFWATATIQTKNHSIADVVSQAYSYILN